MHLSTRPAGSRAARGRVDDPSRTNGASLPSLPGANTGRTSEAPTSATTSATRAKRTVFTRSAGEGRDEVTRDPAQLSRGLGGVSDTDHGAIVPHPDPDLAADAVGEGRHGPRDALRAREPLLPLGLRALGFEGGRGAPR